MKKLLCAVLSLTLLLFWLSRPPKKQHVWIGDGIGVAPQRPLRDSPVVPVISWGRSSSPLPGTTYFGPPAGICLNVSTALLSSLRLGWGEPFLFRATEE